MRRRIHKHTKMASVAFFASFMSPRPISFLCTLTNNFPSASASPSSCAVTSSADGPSAMLSPAIPDSPNTCQVSFDTCWVYFDTCQVSFDTYQVSFDTYQVSFDSCSVSWLRWRRFMKSLYSDEQFRVQGLVYIVMNTLCRDEKIIQ